MAPIVIIVTIIIIIIIIIITITITICYARIVYVLDEAAKNIGIHAYYPQVRKGFTNILRQLDTQIGRGLMTTKTENKLKDLDDVIT